MTIWGYACCWGPQLAAFHTHTILYSSPYRSPRKTWTRQPLQCYTSREYNELAKENELLPFTPAIRVGVDALPL
jgi:hypothetical protein